MIVNQKRAFANLLIYPSSSDIQEGTLVPDGLAEMQEEPLLTVNFHYNLYRKMTGSILLGPLAAPGIFSMFSCQLSSNTGQL